MVDKRPKRPERQDLGGKDDAEKGVSANTESTSNDPPDPSQVLATRGPMLRSSEVSRRCSEAPEPSAAIDEIFCNHMHDTFFVLHSSTDLQQL